MKKKIGGGKNGLGTQLIEEVKVIDPTEALRKIVEQIKRNE